MQQQCISTYSSVKAVSAEIESGMEPLMLVLLRALYSSPSIQSHPTAQNTSPVCKQQSNAQPSHYHDTHYHSLQPSVPVLQVLISLSAPTEPR